jgi:hypothetical protein
VAARSAEREEDLMEPFSCSATTRVLPYTTSIEFNNSEVDIKKWMEKVEKE